MEVVKDGHGYGESPQGVRKPKDLELSKMGDNSCRVT